MSSNPKHQTASASLTTHTGTHRFYTTNPPASQIPPSESSSSLHAAASPAIGTGVCHDLPISPLLPRHRPKLWTRCTLPPRNTPCRWIFGKGTFNMLIILPSSTPGKGFVIPRTTSKSGALQMNSVVTNLSRRHLVRLWLRDPENIWETQAARGRWDRIYEGVTAETSSFPLEPRARRASRGAAQRGGERGGGGG